MRRMPKIPGVPKQTRMTTTFLGYNHNEIIEDGEMYDMQNMSGHLYPILAPRRKRGITSYDTGSSTVPMNGIHGRDQLVFIRGRTVYYNLYPVMDLPLTSTDSNMLPKKIVSFGAYVCIFPDKYYFNTADLTDYGSMDRLYSANGTNVQVCMCRGDGTNYNMESIIVSPDQPELPSNGDLWIDQSGAEDVLKQYMSATEDWMEITTTYIKIQATAIGSGLKMYDVINLSGMELDSEIDNDRLRQQIDDLNGAHIVYYAGQNYVVVSGILSVAQNALEAGTVRADREVPDMDFVCESNNRLWGCKYGLRGEETVNEIYASALGDFRNWNRFMGNSQDSYAASVGTEGAFTGAISQRGYPVFFKEDYIHRVSGQTPSTFSVTTTACRGVQRGSWRSVQIVNEAIFYKSRRGVMRYEGGMPVSVGDQLGELLYSDARAGVLGDKYYISMKDASANWHQFVYDTEKNAWHKEDDFHPLGYGTVGDELYAIDEENNTLVAMTGSMGELEGNFNWSATFGLQGVEYGRRSYGSKFRNDLSSKHYMSRFVLRIYIEPETTVKLEVKYMNGDWETIGEIRGERLDSYLIPVIPRRCDHMRFRISGSGDCRIYSIARQMEVSSDA